MKRVIALILIIALLLCATACADTQEEETSPDAEGEVFSVMALLPSFEGSYFSAALNAVKTLEENYPGKVSVNAAEMGAIAMEDATAENELAAYQPFFDEACQSGEYDLIVCCGAECNAALVYAAETYPQQKFFNLDIQSVPETFAESPAENVYGVCYDNKDLGYLAGYVACQVTTSDMEKANEDKKVGVIVGVDVPGMNEYIGGFCQVCEENGVTVYIDYAGDFTEDVIPAVAEKAKAMYDDGVDVIWQVAGTAGNGVFQAAKEAGRYAFGVDCDQTLTVTDAEEAATIVTSFYADFTASMDAVYQSVVQGNFPGGTYPTVGLKEGFVGYADNEQFQSMTNEGIRTSIANLYAEMSTGEVEIFSVLADPEGWESLKAAVAPAQENYNLLLLVPKVGDKSYFDGAAAGLELIEETYGNVTTEIITMGAEEADWANYPTYFDEACKSGKYDLIITGGGECTNALVEAATNYPEQLFFDFDYQDTFGNDLPNIYGVYYKSYDMGYLAGYLASQITVSDMELANEEKKVGAVVGMDIPDLNDFVGSFCQACIDCGVQAEIVYCNTFSDQELAYDCAMRLYNSGHDVVWQVAGSAGMGVFQASVDSGRYAFGVDVDQVDVINDPTLTANIVTSFYKDYAQTILTAFEAMINDGYPGGVTLAVGLAERGVGLADNEQYRALVPESIRASLADLYEKVENGEIVPFSALFDQEAWPAIRDQAAQTVE